MMIEQHYDEEVLIGLIDAPQADPHVASCEKCAAALNSIRQVTSALGDGAVWDQRELDEEPRPATREALRSFALNVAAEDAAAEPWVKTLTARSSSEWRAMVEKHPEWRTAGFVRRLIVAVDAINFTAPTDAVELMKIAVDVAEALQGASERLAKVRAAAWREYAYALNMVGAHHEALTALERCEVFLLPLEIHEYEFARVQLVRALPLTYIGRIAEALDVARAARVIFLRFGDRRRALVARITEGSTLMDAQRYAESFRLHTEIMADATADAISRAAATHNAAVCCRELGDLEQAKRLFVHAVEQYDKLDVPVFRAKASWNFARILVSEGRYEAAVDGFVAVRREAEQLGLSHTVALVSLDIAEALLVMGRVQEVSELCLGAMDYFRRARLTFTEGALAALAYLREAADSKALTVHDLKKVRSFLEVLPQQPHLLFARPQ